MSRKWILLGLTILLLLDYDEVQYFFIYFISKILIILVIWKHFQS